MKKYSCLTWSKEDFYGSEDLMDKFFNESEDAIIEAIQEIKHIWMLDNQKSVTIYYNDVFVSEEPNEIAANCPYVVVPIQNAIEYADNKIDSGEWEAYCIPELIRTHQVIFHNE